MKNQNKNETTSSISRRTFLTKSALLAGAVGVVPNMLIAQFHANQSTSELEGIIEHQVIRTGWKIKSFEPTSVLDANILNEALEASDKNGWLKIPSVPAMPHGLLLHHKMIEEPWKPFGMEKCFWVSQKDWVYSTKFKVKDVKDEYRLVFAELKEKVDIYMNEDRVATHQDQSQPCKIDLTGKLSDENHLILHFYKAAPNSEPGQPDISRKQKNGTYLGPNPMLYISGIIGEVILERTRGSLIDEIVTDFSLNEDYTKGKVKLSIRGKSKLNEVLIKAHLINPNGKDVDISTKNISVSDGTFIANLTLEVENPDLWWPRGYGEQKLYKVEITLHISNKVHQSELRTIGFRKITMPENLHFMVNGKAIFLRGGNWVTPDLMNEVWDQQRMEGLFDLAENANFNAFRIWGPREAPNDRFYEMADQRGFLLWQDFTRMPFGRNSDKIELAKTKATKFLKRLKHHPCILLWCGINESAMWWHEDFTGDFSEDYKDRGPWAGLKAAEAVGEVCKELDPDRYYIPSAPYGGNNANNPEEGSTNGYTNMWFIPGYDYLNFASEDTRISCPTLNSMEKFMLPEEICPEGYTTVSLHGNMNPYPDTWLAFTSAESWKKTGPVEQFYDATDAASIANRIGMAEGVYYRDIIERQRRGRPATENSDRRCCGGYIVWKYNDSWPSIYSAKVDYFLEPYHVYYTLKEAYAPVILSFDIGTYIYLWAVNDSTEEVSGIIKIQLYHLQVCRFRQKIEKEVTIAPGQSMVVVRLDEEGIGTFRKEFVLFAELKDKTGDVIARTNALADIERRCIFPDAKLVVKVEGRSLIITTDKFARNINLQGDADGEKLGWFFEDNYFDLLPGEKKIVKILGHHTKGVITAKPWYSPHSTTVKWQKI